jgi:hypothetical protein
MIITNLKIEKTKIEKGNTTYEKYQKLKELKNITLS